MPSDSLSLAALKYAAGELNTIDSAAFELKLADDPAARDALEEAVRLSAAAVGQPEFLPDPLIRSAVTEELRPHRSFVSRLFARRPYRGHPLTWTAAGAGSSATAAFVLWLGVVPPATENRAPITNQSLLAVAPIATPTLPAAIPATIASEPLAESTPPMGESVGSTNGIVDTEGKTARPSTFVPEFPKLEFPSGPAGDG